jgi:hypothetical protein
LTFFNSQPRAPRQNRIDEWNSNATWQECVMSSDKTGKQGSEQVQGEGDRESAKRYNQDTREFVESGKVDEAAEQAAGQDPDEAEGSEKAGRERAREVDPAVSRDYDKPQK